MAVSLQKSSHTNRNTIRVSGSRELVDHTFILSPNRKAAAGDRSKQDSKFDHKLDMGGLPSITSQRTPTLAAPSEGPNDSVTAAGSVKSRKLSAMPFGGAAHAISGAPSRAMQNFSAIHTPKLGSHAHALSTTLGSKSSSTRNQTHAFDGRRFTLDDGKSD